MLSFKEFISLEQQDEPRLEPASEGVNLNRKGALVAIKASSRRRSNAAHKSLKRSLRFLRVKKRNNTQAGVDALPEAIEGVLQGLREMNSQLHQTIKLLTLSIQLNQRTHRELLELLKNTNK